MKVLVLAAHPDDEVLGCGGTIARLAEEGHEVHVAILGEGITSRARSPLDADADAVSKLRAQSEHVAKLLGADSCRQLGLPDNRFDSLHMLDVVKLVERLIEDLAPEVVFTQHGGDLNIDHVVLYRATLTATRPVAGGQVRDVYAYEVGSSSEWSFQRFEPHFHPNVFVDITETLERKLDAMDLYESEARPFPHPRSREALRAQAMRWGSASGMEAAEAFELVRSVRSKALL